MSTITKINSFAAESIVQRLAITAGAKPVHFETTQLVRIAKATRLGWQRLKKALPYLLSEYGRHIKNGRYAMEWDAVPAAVILDYVYGLDAVFLWRGWCIGIDATTNSNAVAQKQSKLRLLQPLLQALQIDCAAVAQVSSHANRTEFIQNLRRIIQGETLIQL
ncbi:hypothetical protein [Floridanema aerugineum]|uniref:Uncharacterized protein n=1 Tax=Floridaenema aerugineum BLCC-F46 TaxID=3153654 RepID=A0ABV4XAL7_9CYAN